MKSIMGILASLAVLVLVPGCGGDDDGGDGGGDASHGVYIDGGNAATMAGYFAQTLDVMMSVSRAELALVNAATEPPTGGAIVGRGLVQLGDLGICDSGQSVGTWNDADDDAELSAGDILTLTLTNCDNVTHGTLVLGFSQIDQTGATADVSLDVTFTDVVDRQAQTTTIDGHFTTEVTAQTNPPETVVFRHLVPDGSDPASRIVVTRNGTQIATIGCFNLYFTLNTNTGTFTASEPLAVYGIPGLGVMSVGGYGPQYVMIFNGSDVPVSGAADFFAESFVLPCSALGVPSGGVDANSSHMTMTASADGSLTLTGTDASGSPFSFTVNWNDIN